MAKKQYHEHYKVPAIFALQSDYWAHYFETLCQARKEINKLPHDWKMILTKHITYSVYCPDDDNDRSDRKINKNERCQCKVCNGARWTMKLKKVA